MPVPWLQIVQLVPSIVEVSRELLRKTRRSTPAAADMPRLEDGDRSALSARVAVLEENERRQAELINQMAEQIAVLTRAVTDLHQRGLWLILGATGAASLAIVALVMASQR